MAATSVDHAVKFIPTSTNHPGMDSIPIPASVAGIAAAHDNQRQTTSTKASPGNPWAKTATASPGTATSLADVMSEELAKSIDQKEKRKSESEAESTRIPDNIARDYDVMEPELLPGGVTDQETNDYLIAQMLQYELDLEHDQLLQRQERHFNGPSKVGVSLSNYRHLHPAESRDELSPVTDFPEPKDAQDRPPEFNARGYYGKGKNIVTKHDPEVCGRRNAEKVMSFPPSFVTGDDILYDSKLSNKVFNELKVHSMHEEKRGHRVKDKKEDVATATLAVDQKTRLLMYKMVNGGTLGAINGVISTGKESVVFHAAGGVVEELQLQLPEECALKVFKTTLNEFRNRDPYIRDDYRFQERFSKLNPRKIVKFWAEKEMLNLKRMTENGIPCPEPILLRKHILVMKFLGKDQKAAPKLKDVPLSLQQKKRAYTETVQIMRKMFADCKLIHADFSEYNLLWHEDKVWVIDVSQSVEPAHPRALEFLYRDCSNVFNFFQRIGLDDVLPVKELFAEITGIQLHATGEEVFLEIQRHESSKKKPHKFNPEAEGASFDYLYNLASQERAEMANASEGNEGDWVDDEDSDDDDE